MKINKKYLKDVAKKILLTPSPSGYTSDVMVIIEKMVNDLGYQFEKTKKGCGVITVNGKNKDYVVGLSAHVDTLGLMVRSIKNDGTLRVSSIGGNQFNSLDGEYCVIHSKTKKHLGTILSNAPASHVHKENGTLVRNEENMHVRIDEITYSKKDTEKIGICTGDFISIEPKTEFTKAGFLKSRYLDDKGSVACLMTLLNCFRENDLKPKNTLKLFISTYEEVGHGAAYIPKEIDELLAVDMGCIGKDLKCTEEMVSICAKDSSGPYDFEMRTKLTELAIENKLKYAVDIYPYYGSDASSALRGGNNVRCALIGPGVAASHGMERTHINGLINTIELLILYVV